MPKESPSATNGGGGPLAGIRARIAGGISGSAGRNVNPTYKTGTLAEPTSGVRVRPAAKQQPNKLDAAKTNYKANESAYRAYGKAIKEYERTAGASGNEYEMHHEGRVAMSEAQAGRKTNIQGRKLNEAEARKATTPVVKGRAAKSTAKIIKINSAPKKK